MPQRDPSGANSTHDEAAYLVVREGSTWRDVFRLQPGQVTTIGRAPTNRIVLRDEICSRNHCEIFRISDRWTLRDLGSRNGTLVNGKRVAGDWELEDGELIQIGGCEMGFTHDISRPFPQFADFESDTALDHVLDHAASDSEPEIILRARDSRYRTSSGQDSVARDRTSRELAKLYRLALEMGTARDAAALSEIVLEGLFSGTSADTGAILLFPGGKTEEPRPAQLQAIVYDAKSDVPYQKVSEHLAGVVLSGREAVLARDVADDSRLVSRDSLGEIHAQSVICAPIRVDDGILGLVHLYSTSPDNALDPEDLEFTLAVADQLALALENLKEKESLAVGLARAQDENLTLRRQLGIESELVGDSPVIERLRQKILRIAPTDATVLIRGESGVGKELVARAIHFSSDRRNGPFVCMNCAALSESLLESELFGHERGSFTGATERKIGKFEQADRGTLFLDEVGEMSPGIQAKFLRVLEGHPFERVGGRAQIQVDVRVVAATNRDLKREVERSAFRMDLYFRLQVVELPVEPLRERRSDIPLLARYFLERFSRKSHQPLRRLSRGALEAMLKYDWPGNVRELQNVVERAAILCPHEQLEETDIHLTMLAAVDGRSSTAPALAEDYREVSLEALEQQHILATLERTGWNKSRAAQILGIERSTLDRKLKRYRVRRPRP
ncbi:MAG TPA: sigma 54-interacting transcriptional regulator [Planctomycetaceae bacterium]|nr:sigma 54-interacting transcriptional regulator [Planctomycetaceae bacterium]